MARRRTGAITTAAVLNIVFGSLFVLCCGLGGIAGLLAGPASQDMIKSMGLGVIQELNDEVMKELPIYHATEIFRVIFLLLVGVAWIVLGIGLLGMRRWARTGTIVVGVVFILWVFLETGFTAVLVAPATERATETVALAHPEFYKGQADPGKQARMSGMIGAFVTALLYLAFALPPWILMLTSGTRRAFSDQAVPNEPGDDGRDDVGRRDDDWDRRRDDDREGGAFRPADRF